MARIGQLPIEVTELAALLDLPEDTVIAGAVVIELDDKVVVNLTLNHSAFPIYQGGLIPIVEPVFESNTFTGKQFKHWDLKT